MDNNILADQINTLLGAEIRGLARHIDEAKPYLSQRTYKAWSVICQMSHVSREHAEQLTELLEEMEVEPRPGPFDMEVANYHFMTVEALLPLLIEEKEKQVAAYQNALAQVAGHAHVAGVVQTLLLENQDQLAQLRTLAQGGSPAAPAPAKH